MKFLLDENISPNLCLAIKDMGYEARHVKHVGLIATSDKTIFEFAQKSNEIIITHDLDYSRIHALSGATKPSVILIRIEPISNEIITDFLKANVEQLRNELPKRRFCGS